MLWFLVLIWVFSSKKFITEGHCWKMQAWMCCSGNTSGDLPSFQFALFCPVLQISNCLFNVGLKLLLFRCWLHTKAYSYQTVKHYSEKLPDKCDSTCSSEMYQHCSYLFDLKTLNLCSFFPLASKLSSITRQFHFWKLLVPLSEHSCLMFCLLLHFKTLFSCLQCLWAVDH